MKVGGQPAATAAALARGCYCCVFVLLFFEKKLVANQLCLSFSYLHYFHGFEFDFEYIICVNQNKGISVHAKTDEEQ
jgi:hypothetical protein